VLIAHATALTVTLKRNDQLCIPEHRYIRIVRANDDLALTLQFAQTSHDP
jgi:hypothetical protein